MNRPAVPGTSAADRIVAGVDGSRSSKVALRRASTRVVMVGNSAAVLVEGSKGASLVAVGTRSHRGFASLPLGSVSQHLVTDARRPVVVVHEALES